MMISPTKSGKMLAALKDYKKRYISKHIKDIDESGTRIMINNFLTSILGYHELLEIKTEFLVKGMYVDYMIQTGGRRHFLVEVKSFSLELSEKHLRQAINYGANEGIDWAILTNGKQFHFYKILFKKPIRERLVFKLDFSSENFNFKEAKEQLSYFYRDAVLKNSLASLWSRYSALEPVGLSGLLFSPVVIDFLKKELKEKYDTLFQDAEIKDAITDLICTEIPPEKLKVRKAKSVIKKKPAMKVVVTKPAKIPVSSNNNMMVESAA